MTNKCVQCDHHMGGAAKFCPECGAKALREQSKATKAGPSAPPDGTLELPGMEISILAAEVRLGTEEDEHAEIEVRYQLVNHTNSNWAHETAYIHLVRTGGDRIGREHVERHNRIINAGESAEFKYVGTEYSTGFDKDPSRIKLVLSVLAYAVVASVELGKVIFPKTPKKPALLPSTKIADLVLIPFGTVQKHNGEFGEEIQINVRVQSLCLDFLMVFLSGVMMSKSGVESLMLSEGDELRPGEILEHGYDNSSLIRRWVDQPDIVAVRFEVARPVAVGTVHRNGLTVDSLYTFLTEADANRDFMNDDLLARMEDKILERGWLGDVLGTFEYRLSILLAKDDSHVVAVNIESEDENASLSEDDGAGLSWHIMDKIEEYLDYREDIPMARKIAIKRHVENCSVFMNGVFVYI